MKSCLTLVLGLLLILPASARLGETREECSNRYGKPVKEEKSGLSMYRKSGLIIAISFLDGHAAMMVFRKAENDALGKGKPFSQAEIETLLEASKGETSWEKVERPVIMKSYWQRTDGSAFAESDKMENTLSLMTQAFFKKEAAEKEAKEKKALEGF